MSNRVKLILAAVLFVAGTALQISSYQNKAVAGTLAVFSAALVLWAVVSPKQ